jgi:hypothetical protein
LPVSTPAQEQPPSEEAKLTGTDGRILPFPRLVTSEVKPPEPESENAPDTSEVTQPQSNDLFDLSSVKEMLVWRPVKFERKKHYPKVVPDGCGWKQDGGGFTLSRQKPTKYLGYFRLDAIRNLERLYGKKKPRKKS